jgi:hypothetical protein
MFEYKTEPVDEPVGLRDRIAIAALTGLLADPQVQANITTAKLCYQIAEWMLEARKSSSTESPTRT